MQGRRVGLVAVGAALLLTAAVAQPPKADVRILTHDVGDLTPRRMEAAIDLGVGAISLLVTWSSRAR